ncbi:MAG: hypothetical protein ACRD0Q_02920 [Acidimicrobiales bacterium]
MTQLDIRDEELPGDAVIIVRGGEMHQQHLRRTAMRGFEELGLYLISVFATLDLDLVTLCKTERDLNRYGQVRTSTFGDLRAAGFALIPTMARPHFDVVLPDLSDEVFHRLNFVFSPPVPNPGRPATS